VAKHYLVIGPWDHGGTQVPGKEIEGLAIPPNAVLDMNQLHADWYDWALGRAPLPQFFQSQRVAFYVMGENAWRHAPTLEAASSGKDLVLHLSDPQGTPAGVFQAGGLVTRAPRAEPPAQLVSDPRELPELEVAGYAADENLLSTFRAYQKRALVFHSEPFATDVTFAGHMRLLLECAADAPDFDLSAQVMMISPDGTAVQLGQDLRRARFRNSPFRSELLRPGEVVEIPFQFNWAAWRIPAGARLRLVVTPLNSPNYQKNYNTGGRIGYERLEDARVAHVRIFHDARHASRLILPLANEALAPTVATSSAPR
jgi:putative CocE/NonD family hydrolase